MNPIVKAFIVSELFVWSSWNFVTPIFAVFVVNDITNGSVELAAFAFSAYMIARVIFELASGRYLAHVSEEAKFITTIIGIILVSVSYLGLGMIHTIPWLFFFICLSGAGIGVATPAKNALFSIHLDKGKESTEWGIYDAIIFVGMATATALGGVIAKQYGFPPLFLLGSIINFLGILPYILYIRR